MPADRRAAAVNTGWLSLRCPGWRPRGVAVADEIPDPAIARDRTEFGMTSSHLRPHRNQIGQHVSVARPTSHNFIPADAA